MDTVNAPPTTRTEPQAGDVARRWIGWALVATLVSYATGLAFIFGTDWSAALSDLGSAVVAVLYLPMMWHIRRVFDRTSPNRSKHAWVIGATAATVIVVTSVGLLLGDTGVAQNLAAGVALGGQFLGYAILGIWLILVGRLARDAGRFRQRTWRAALLAGTGYVVGIGSNAVAGFFNPLFVIGFLFATFGFVAWAVWMRTDLLEGST